MSKLDKLTKPLPVVVDIILKIAVIVMVYLIGSHINDLVTANKTLLDTTKTLIFQHRSLTEENKALNEQQIDLITKHQKITEDNRTINLEQTKMLKVIQERLDKK